MKIAHLIPQFYPHIGGAEICVHNVCKNLTDSGHEAFVITSTPPPKNPPSLPYKMIYLSSKTGGLFRKIPCLGKLYLDWKIKSLQRKHKFDLWQVTMGYPLGAYAVDSFRRLGIPCLLRCCGEDVQKFTEIGYGYRLNEAVDELVTTKYPLYDGLVALTPSVRDEYLAMGIPCEKVRIIPNGVNNMVFKNKDHNKTQSIRKDYGVSDDAKIILTVGRYHPKKGFDLIPAIADILKERGVKFVWLVVGKNTSKIKDKHPDCEKNNVVFVEKFSGDNAQDKFMLPTSGLIDIYNASDLFALPTLIETFGMVLVEAMAAGLPIVTTDALGVRDVINDGVNGAKVPTNDVKSFADAIGRIFTDDALTASLSTNAQREAEEKYDWAVVTKQYSDYYNYIIGKYK